MSRDHLNAASTLLICSKIIALTKIKISPHTPSRRNSVSQSVNEPVCHKIIRTKLSNEKVACQEFFQGYLQLWHHYIPRYLALARSLSMSTVPFPFKMKKGIREKWTQEQGNELFAWPLSLGCSLRWNCFGARFLAGLAGVMTFFMNLQRKDFVVTFRVFIAFFTWWFLVWEINHAFPQLIQLSQCNNWSI